jgi:hypothetical protein
MRAPLSAFLSTSFLEYSCIIQSSKLDKQKTPHRRPVRGFGVVRFLVLETLAAPAPTAHDEQQVYGQ